MKKGRKKCTVGDTHSCQYPFCGSLKTASMSSLNTAAVLHFENTFLFLYREIMMMIHEVQRNVILHGLLNKENMMMMGDRDAAMQQRMERTRKL